MGSTRGDGSMETVSKLGILVATGSLTRRGLTNGDRVPRSSEGHELLLNNDLSCLQNHSSPKVKRAGSVDPAPQNYEILSFETASMDPSPRVITISFHEASVGRNWIKDRLFLRFHYFKSCYPPAISDR